MPTEKRQRQKEGRVARQAELQAYRRRAARRRQVITGAAIVAVVVLIIALVQRGQDDENLTAGATTTALSVPTTTIPRPSNVGTTPCPPADGSATRTITFDGQPQGCVDEKKTYTARVETDVGAFTIALDLAKAPITVNNFVFLSRYHYYDGVKFHRVIPGFVVQGGDGEKGDGTGGPGYRILDELPGANEYRIGSVAMANAGPNTGGSQFFIVTGEQGAKLPPGYALFGTVTEGLDVVKKIEADGSPEGTPTTPHQINKVTITET
jgi:cyclophilin family peptidyl-prolyl cis-trans isomerase